MDLNQELKKEFPYRPHYFEHLNYKQHYLDEGEGDEVFVMVHGNPTWSFYYRNLLNSLKENYRVIVPDHIGCGRSDHPEGYEYTLENRINDLSKLLENLNIKKYHLVVHDWGGAIGIGTAVKDLSKLQSLTILNTAAFRSKVIPKSIALCKLPLFGPFIVKYLNAFCYPATFMTTEKPLSKMIKFGYLSPYNKPSRRKAISEFVKDIPLDPSHPSYETLKEIELQLTDIKCPVQILWGGKDFCFNDHFYNRWLEIFPKAKRVYFENAGHYILEDEPLKVEKEIKDFVEGIHEV